MRTWVVRNFSTYFYTTSEYFICFANFSLRIADLLGKKKRGTSLNSSITLFLESLLYYLM